MLSLESRMKPWFALLILITGVAGNAFAFFDVVDIRVVDERGVPVPGATVGLIWKSNSYEKVLTDRDGKIRVRGYAPYNQVDMDIEAENHYKTRFSLPMPYNCTGNKCQIGSRDTVDVLLKRKVKPIPMVHHYVSEIPPDRSRLMDFDLVVADWVKPHGKGEVADVSYFHSCTVKNMRRFQAVEFKDAYDESALKLGNGRLELARRKIVGGVPEPCTRARYSCSLELPKPEPQDGYEIFAVSASDVDCRGELRFNNPGDGLQFVPLVPPDRPWWARTISALKSDHLAPENGYQAVWTYSNKNPPPSTGEQVGYLRIRSKTGPDGKLVSAWYGKVYDRNAALIASVPKLHMKYYINPDGTRNVEYDPARNLGSEPDGEP